MNTLLGAASAIDGKVMTYNTFGEQVKVGPIYTGNAEVIKIFGGGALTIYGESRQPCIGPETNDGLSYGRWSESPSNKLKKIIIDGTQVMFINKNENFSIGAYNYEEYPVVELINGGRLINCPEMTGTRELIFTAYPPSGSTKIVNDPTYIIVAPEHDLSNYVTKEHIAFMNYLKLIGRSELIKLVSPRTLSDGMERAKRLLSLNKDAHVASLINGLHNKNLYIVECACVLEMPGDTCDYDELYFEQCKYETICERYHKYDKYPDRKAYDCVVCTIVHGLFEDKNFGSLTPWQKEMIYEMIPSYFFSFSGYKQHEDAAKAFYENTLKK
jgi:hypothetical protein